MHSVFRFTAIIALLLTIPLCILFKTPLSLPLVFIIGALFPSFVSILTPRLVNRLAGASHFSINGSIDDSPQPSGNESSPGLYGLDHAILNVPSLKAESMWMNMGYWRDATNLPQASGALLEKVLETAELTRNTTTAVCEHSGNENGDAFIRNRPNGREVEHSQKQRRRVLLDLGIGCGEQTLYLVKRTERKVPTRGKVISEDVEREATTRDCVTLPLFDHYVGITIDKAQYNFARAKINATRWNNDSQITGADVFHADAGDPSSWPVELQTCVSTAFTQKSYTDEDNDSPEIERYVLALDTLYHFRPSRRRIFEYSYSVLQANFLAFDLLLAPPSQFTLRSLLHTFFLRVLSLSLSAPFSNFLTPAAYRAQLQDAGYADEDITIEDITDDVFAGLATFLETRHRELTALGLGGFTKWRISGLIFRWLAAGDVLRAAVVVAKSRNNPHTSI